MCFQAFIWSSRRPTMLDAGGGETAAEQTAVRAASRPRVGAVSEIIRSRAHYAD
jgi:hypothetical protein